MRLTRAGAKSLAVRYSEFNKAFEAGDNKSIIMYGTLLKERQEKVGIVMYSSDLLTKLIEISKLKEAEKSAGS